LDSESKLNSELLNKLLLSCKDINTNLSVIVDSMSKKTTLIECKDIFKDNEKNVNLQNTEIKKNDTNNLKKKVDENNLNKKVFSNYIDELKSVLQSREKVN
jgi:formyltetrahydrofolate hydrolase